MMMSSMKLEAVVDVISTSNSWDMQLVVVVV